MTLAFLIVINVLTSRLYVKWDWYGVLTVIIPLLILAILISAKSFNPCVDIVYCKKFLTVYLQFVTL